jgi:hypothetical protein
MFMPRPQALALVNQLSYFCNKNIRSESRTPFISHASQQSQNIKQKRFAGTARLKGHFRLRSFPDYPKYLRMLPPEASVRQRPEKRHGRYGKEVNDRKNAGLSGLA